MLLEQPHPEPRRFIEVWYRDVIERPTEQAARVREFLSLDLDRAAMAACVDASLHHRLRDTGGRTPRAAAYSPKLGGGGQS